MHFVQCDHMAQDLATQLPIQRPLWHSATALGRSSAWDFDPLVNNVMPYRQTSSLKTQLKKLKAIIISR